MKKTRTNHYVALLVGALLITVIALGGATAQAVSIPVGVQENVLLSTVTGVWGWNQIYRDNYNVNSVSVADMFNGHGDYIMLGAIQDGSDTIELLAATTWTDFTTYTPHNVTHTSNGAEWYNNNGSLGFAGLGDSIAQNSADTNGTNAGLRLSWHTHDSSPIYTSLATDVRYGWRAGEFTGLNGSTNWDKIVFTMDAQPVPEPSTMLLLGSGLFGVVALRKKIKKN